MLSIRLPHQPDIPSLEANPLRDLRQHPQHRHRGHTSPHKHDQTPEPIRPKHLRIGHLPRLINRRSHQWPNDRRHSSHQRQAQKDAGRLGVLEFGDVEGGGLPGGAEGTGGETEQEGEDDDEGEGSTKSPEKDGGEGGGDADHADDVGVRELVACEAAG